MKKTAAAVVLAAIVCTSPLQAQRRVEEIVARVNSQIILKSELDKELRQLAEDLKREPGAGEYLQLSKDVLRNLIDVTLLMQVAKEQGVDVETSIVKRLDEIRIKNKLATMEDLEAAMRSQGVSMEDLKETWRRDLLTQEVMSREVASRIIVSTEEMRKYYDTHKDEFKHEAGTKVGDIGVFLMNGPEPDQRKKIEEAHAALKTGTDFAEVAQKYSERSSAARGGEVGFVETADFPNLDPIIAAELAKLEKGQITEILTMPDGFLILKALDKHTGGILSFELAQNEIYGKVITKQLQPKVREYLNKLREDGFVEVKEGYTDTGAVKRTEHAASVKGKKK